jgi:hypothetical protein
MTIMSTDHETLRFSTIRVHVAYRQPKKSNGREARNVESDVLPVARTDYLLDTSAVWWKANVNRCVKTTPEMGFYPVSLACF